MRRIVLFAAFLCLAFTSAHAIYFDATLQDSRFTEKNHIYNPAGIVGLALEGGFFNEPENMVDYKLSLGIRRFGYSHSDGDVSVSLWEIEFKPLIYSVTFKGVMLEGYLGMGYIFAASNINDEMRDHLEGKDARGNHNFLTDMVESSTINFGYRIGYWITEQFLVALVANYQEPCPGWQYPHESSFHVAVGGIGVNVQWNAPW